MQQRLKTSHRRGAALVEFAVVVPVFVLLVLGAIDVGRAIHVRHTLVETARSACRLYALRNEIPLADVNAAVDEAMRNAGIDDYAISVDPDPAIQAVPLEPITLTVSVPFDEVSWCPSWFLRGDTLAATCVMPADIGKSSDQSP